MSTIKDELLFFFDTALGTSDTQSASDCHIYLSLSVAVVTSVSHHIQHFLSSTLEVRCTIDTSSLCSIYSPGYVPHLSLPCRHLHYFSFHNKSNFVNLRLQRSCISPPFIAFLVFTFISSSLPSSMEAPT